MSGADRALDRVQEGWRRGWSTGWPAAVGMAGLALWLYCGSLAPDLTWAHQGADGGELLAAAATNGVPHPPGYPLYILLLQGWLALLEGVAPSTSLVWRGNLLS
ncbi:MAG: protein O-mannosyl-transferase family, partial [Caldilinea sp.]